MSASQVAYLTLKEGKPSQGQGLKALSPARGAQADHQSSCLQSNFTASPHQDIQPTGRMVFKPKGEEAEDDEGSEELDEHLLNLVTQPVMSSTCKRKSSPTILSPSSPTVLLLPSPTALSTSSVPPNPLASSSLSSEALGGTDTYYPSKIRVLPHTPNMKLPKDGKMDPKDESCVALSEVGCQLNE